MKKRMRSVLAILMTTTAIAIAEPLQLSLTPDVALHRRTTRIEGLSLSIWGENPQAALALGFVNGSVGDSAGLSLGFLINYADSYKGIHWAPVNYASGDFLGWQGGLVNYTEGRYKGLQTGTVNCAGHLSGLQLGLLNYAQDAQTGVQIGLVNLMPRNEWFSQLPDALAPGMLFVNWRF